jgi:hypothetical protein
VKLSHLLAVSDAQLLRRNQCGKRGRTPSHSIAVRCGSGGLAKLPRLQSLDQFKGMDWFRDQFKLEALPMTSQQYL